MAETSGAKVSTVSGGLLRLPLAGACSTTGASITFFVRPFLEFPWGSSVGGVFFGASVIEETG